MMRSTLLGSAGAGGGGSLIQLGTHTAEAENTGGVTVSITFMTDGRLRVTEAGSNRDIPEQWYVGWASTDIGDSYDVRCASISYDSNGQGFTAEADDVGDFIQITDNRAWTVTAAAFNSHIIDAVFEIRENGETEVLATATLSFRAIGV